jgi:hypothetical protein
MLHYYYGGVYSMSLRRCARVFVPIGVMLIVVVAPPGGVPTPAFARSPGVSASRNAVLQETIQARLVSHRGATYLNEQGHGSGTFACSLSVQITLSYAQAAIAYSCRTAKGTIDGAGKVAFYLSGPTTHFSGPLDFTHGTGAFAHATGSKWHIEGTLARGTYALSAVVTGKIGL